MFATLDQFFVLLKHWLVGFLPAGWQPAAAVVLSVAVIVCLFPALFALTVLLERKGLGRMQNRIGPNRVGPFGILQPIADGIKSLTKEDIVPTRADGVVHFLAPVVLVVAVFRSEEHTSELQSLRHLVCRLPLEKKNALLRTFQQGALQLQRRQSVARIPHLPYLHVGLFF